MSEFKSVKEFSNLFTFEEKGQELIGRFVRSYEYTNKKGKTLKVHVLDVDQPAPAGGSAEVQIFGSGMLDHLMEKITTGQTIKIVYLGQEQADLPAKGDFQGGKVNVNQWDVLVAS